MSIEGLQWIPHGKLVRYLGCQVGINLSLEDHVAPLMLAIRINCYIAKLSLVGRVVVVNQVLLASMWYILSTWLCSRLALSQVQRLIRNSPWGSKDCSYVSVGDERPSMRKITQQSVLKKNLRIGDARQNTHRERERGTKNISY